MNKKYYKEIQNRLEELKKEQKVSFTSTGTTSYKQLGFTILSLLNACQTHLFLWENENPTAEQEEEVRIDVYNLLEVVKNLLPHMEFEFLDWMFKQD